MGAGNFDNSNQGVGSVVGNANQVSGMQGTAQSKNSLHLCIMKYKFLQNWAPYKIYSNSLFSQQMKKIVQKAY